MKHNQNYRAGGTKFLPSINFSILECQALSEQQRQDDQIIAVHESEGTSFEAYVASVGNGKGQGRLSTTSSVSSRHRTNDGFANENEPAKATTIVKKRSKPVVKTEWR